MQAVEEKMTDVERKRSRHAKQSIISVKSMTFFVVLFLIAAISLIMPLRPSVSNIEKRELEQFPEFTLESFFDGSYYKQIDTWFSDTFPLREILLSGSMKVKSLYGIHSEEIHGDFVEGDEIPTGDEDFDDISVEMSDNDSVNDTDNTEQSDIVVNNGGGEVTLAPEVHGAVYVAGDRAFGFYGFDLNTAKRYVNMINSVTEKLNGTADVYDIVVPTNIGIYLDDEMQKKLNVSNQKESIDFIYKNISDNTKKVEVFDAIKNNNSEYLYFRTDHHWTALGAYYAYKEFCKAHNMKATPVEEYEQVEFPGFLGSFYAEAGQPQSLAANPDTVIAYKPKSTNKFIFTDTEGNSMEWGIISDVSDWNANAKYMCFISGDRPFSVIDNPEINDGTSCVIIKESYGNAFVPFLVDNYDKVYVVDYRYYQENIVEFVKNNNVNDVIFLNNIQGACTSQLVSNMERITN